MVLLEILWNDILPLLVFLLVGWILDARLKPDLNTYTKLITRIVLPLFIFYSLYLYPPDASAALLVPAGIALLFFDSLAALALAKILGFTERKARIFRALSTFSNSGQIGVALILMIFSHAPYLAGGEMPYLDEARGTIVVLLILMNIAVNTFGASLVGVREFSLSRFFKFIVSMPAVYAVAAAILIKTSGFALEHTFLWSVLTHFAGAFIILVTITAGAQLHRTPWKRPDAFDLGISFNKLFISPLLAFFLIWSIGIFTPVAAQVFFIYAAVPSSFTLLLFAVDYDNHPDLAARSVLYCSVIGIFTLTAAIRLARYLFPAGV